MAINFLNVGNFPDEVKLTFGDSSDLQIYHSAATGTSYISDAGTGNLHIQADSFIRLESYTGTEKYALFNLNGSVDLYYDNSKVFETTSAGATITGTTLIVKRHGGDFTIKNDGGQPSGLVLEAGAGGSLTFNTDEGTLALTLDT